MPKFDTVVEFTKVFAQTNKEEQVLHTHAPPSGTLKPVKHRSGSNATWMARLEERHETVVEARRFIRYVCLRSEFWHKYAHL